MLSMCSIFTQIDNYFYAIHNINSLLTIIFVCPIPICPKIK